jgi:hypothetical protein
MGLVRLTIRQQAWQVVEHAGIYCLLASSNSPHSHEQIPEILDEMAKSDLFLISISFNLLLVNIGTSVFYLMTLILTAWKHIRANE